MSTRWPDTEADTGRAEPSLTARLPEIVARAAWKHRWRMAPVYLAAAALIAAGTGTAAALIGVLIGGAAVLEAAARTGITAPGGRMLLSVKERRLAAAGLGGTAGWAGLTLLAPGLPWLVDVLMLWAVLAVPSLGWWASRRPVPPPPSLLSPLAQQVLDGWAADISVGDGPRALRGSVPVEDTLTEPADGALVMNVQLARGVHAGDAVSSATRRAVEALYGLPEDTVRLETIRDNSTQVRVVLTPSRHLEREGGVDWPGPVLNQDGLIPLAETAHGATVEIPLFDRDGVRHGFISGTSGAGKSVSSVSVMLPGVAAGLETILLVDGKRGTSTPYLRPIVSRYARMAEQWGVLIEIAYRVMKDRQDRRGAAGLYEWNTLQEVDPILSLIMDDVTAINRVISGKHAGMVGEILEQGRAVGVRVIQITQSPAFEDIIGGVQARNLMTSAGWAICHRAGGSGASRLTLDSASGVDVDLRGLPDGQAAVLVRGNLAGFPAQVRNATVDKVKEILPSMQARHLDGADLTAAGPEYTAAHWAGCWTPGYVFDPARQAPAPAASATSVIPDWGIPQARTSSPVPAGTAGATSFPAVYGRDGTVELNGAAFEAVNRAWVLQALHERGPMTRSALAQAAAVPDTLLDRVLDGLVSAELIMQGGDQYILAPAAGSAAGARILGDLQQILALAGAPIPAWAATQAATPALAGPGPDDDLPASRRWVLDQLARAPEGMTLKQLQDLADGQPGAPARRTISNALTDLMARRNVSKTGAVWTRAEPETGDEITT